MGCGSSVPAEAADAPKEIAASKPGKTLTFGRDPNLKKEDYMVKNQDGVVVTRPPGTINGQQFLIADCKNCIILLLDHSEQTTLDRCVDCTIVVAACSTSVFARKCTGCTFSFGAKQLRFREARNCVVLAACHSRPVVEDCTGLRFGCWRLWYSALASQLEAAGIDVWANKWNDVYDFGSGGSQPGAAGAGVWTALDSTQEVAFAGNIAAAAPAALATSLHLRVVIGWSTWSAPRTAAAGSLAAQLGNGAADSNAPVHHGKPAEVPSATDSEVRQALAETPDDEALQVSEQVAITPPPGVAAPPSAVSADAPQASAAAPPATPSSGADLLVSSVPAADSTDESWTPCVPLTVPQGGPTAGFLLLLPSSNWPSTAYTALAAINSGQGSDTAGLAVTRCRPFVASAAQLQQLGLQQEKAGDASAGKCLGMQFQWVDAADEGADASAVLRAGLAGASMKPSSFAAIAGQPASNAVQRWFVEWEDEYNK